MKSEAEARVRTPMIAGSVVVVIVTAQTAVLRLLAAPSFGAMFDDFGGRESLPSWTRAWVYGYSPYIVVECVAVALLGLSWVVGERRNAALLVLALGAALFLGNLLSALVAFYGPLFAPAS